MNMQVSFWQKHFNGKTKILEDEHLRSKKIAQVPILFIFVLLPKRLFRQNESCKTILADCLSIFLIQQDLLDQKISTNFLSFIKHNPYLLFDRQNWVSL